MTPQDLAPAEERMNYEGRRMKRTFSFLIIHPSSFLYGLPGFIGPVPSTHRDECRVTDLFARL
jgi:hypothetical protein